MPKREKGALRRLLWFVGLWLAGVASVSVVALTIKLFLG